MSPTRTIPARRPPTPLVPAIFVACLIAAGVARGDDRFFVPVGPSGGGSGSSSGGGSSGGSSGGGGSSSGSGGGGSSYSGGSGSSDSGSSSNNSGNANSGGGRFFVPMPRRSSGGGGGGGGGGGIGGGGDYWVHDPYWGGCYYYGGRYHYWPGYGYPYSVSYTVVRYVPVDPYATDGPMVFFPPEPPPLGTRLPETPPHRGHEISAPPALGGYLAESFYPQLSTRLYRANLSERQIKELETYRTERAALLQELRARLMATQHLPPLQRARELETLGRAQAARFDALASKEEALRTGLLRGGLIGTFGSSGDWSQRRQWRLGTSQSLDREQTLGLEFRVMRAAAFYQDGLTPAQRGLLREVAMELQTDAYSMRTSDPSTPADDGLTFFSPATARVRFAKDLPAPLNAKIDEFRKLRKALKAELRDVVYTRDAENRAARTAALRRLAADQESRIHIMDVLADEIRVDIAGLGRPVRNPPPPLPPPDLTARIAALRTEREYLNIELQGELARLRSSSSQAQPLSAAQAREQLAAFRATHQARYEALATSQADLRRELATHFANGPRPVSEASIDALLNARDESESPAALWQRYNDYADAVFQPGLTPDQRRLLFGAALEQLGFPLPAGERMP